MGILSDYLNVMMLEYDGKKSNIYFLMLNLCNLMIIHENIIKTIAMILS